MRFGDALALMRYSTHSPRPTTSTHIRSLNSRLGWSINFAALPDGSTATFASCGADAISQVVPACRVSTVCSSCLARVRLVFSSRAS